MNNGTLQILEGKLEFCSEVYYIRSVGNKQQFPKHWYRIYSDDDLY